MAAKKGFMTNDIKVSLDIEDIKLYGVVTSINLGPMNTLGLKIIFPSYEVLEHSTGGIGDTRFPREPKYTTKPSQSEVDIVVECSNQIFQAIEKIIKEAKV